MATIKNRRDQLLQGMRKRLQVVANTEDRPYVISAWIPGTFTEEGEIVISHRSPTNITIPSNFNNSLITFKNSPTQNQIYDIFKGDTLVGNITFYTGSNYYAGSYYYTGSEYYTVTGEQYKGYTGSNAGIFKATEEFSDLTEIPIKAHEEISIRVDSAYVDTTLGNLALTLKCNR